MKPFIGWIVLVGLVFILGVIVEWVMGRVDRSEIEDVFLREMGNREINARWLRGRLEEVGYPMSGPAFYKLASDLYEQGRIGRRRRTKKVEGVPIHEDWYRRREPFV